MGFKKWVVMDSDKSLAKTLAQECNTDPIVALIASARGYSDPTDLEQFLLDEPCFSDPYELKDIELAAECINKAIEDNKKIAIYGDYDCDGVVSTALLYNYLTSRGANCIYYIPDRFDEGYGMNVNAVKTLKEKGIDLIITVDNGISCYMEIEYANSLGITVVVTDHHLPPEVLPNAFAVVDPHRIDCPSTFKQICGAEVVFKLICVLDGKEPEELIYSYADLLCLAVIADIMPLSFENRSIVKCGIRKLKNNAITGLSALLNVAGIETNSVNSRSIAYGLSPRINAAGRMGKADRAVRLLTEKHILEALQIANEIDSENAIRQQIEKEIFNQAVEKIEKNGYFHNRVIVVEGENWYSGVVGIVAARLTERYGVPSIVISVEKDMAHGSGRSIDGFSLFDALNSTSHLLTKFGGHTLAAGLSLKKEDIEAFRKEINEYAFSKPLAVPTIKIDCKLNPAAITVDLTDSLTELEPFGNENQTPIFGLYGVTLQKITPLSNNKHLRLIFSKGENSFKAMLFGIGTNVFCFEEGDCLDLAVTLDTNYYNGNYSVNVTIKAIRMNGTNDDVLFSQIENYNNFYSGYEYDPKQIMPTREEVGLIYKFILQKSALLDRVRYVFLNTLGYAKTELSVNVLLELGLISKNENGLLSAVRSSQKTDLMNSKTYKFITKECESYEQRTKG